MKVLYLTSGPKLPTTRFRTLPYLPYLRARGIDCRVSHSFPPQYEPLPYVGWRISNATRIAGRWRDRLRVCCGRYDVVVIERELFSYNSWDIETSLAGSSAALVWDVDDGLHLEHPQKFDALAGMCDVAVAGNRFLAEKISPLNPCVRIIPTCVDVSHYPRKTWDKANSSLPIIGWVGTSSNLRYFSEVAGALRKLASEKCFRLLIVADRCEPLEKFDLAGVDWEFRPWSEKNELQNLLDMDVGLMPLSAEPWARYKCGLKAIQYLACGIPAVVSPVGVNMDIVQSGVSGFLPSTEEEWYTALSRLIDQPDVRQKMGEAGRQFVEQHFSIQAHVEPWIEVLKLACEQRKRRRK